MFNKERMWKILSKLTTCLFSYPHRCRLLVKVQTFGTIVHAVDRDFDFHTIGSQNQGFFQNSARIPGFFVASFLNYSADKYCRYGPNIHYSA